MTALAPLGLLFLIGVPLVLLLWLLNTRFRTTRVPSLLLWRDVPAPVTVTRNWRLPRLELLLLLQLAFALLSGLALGRLAIDLPPGRHLALVLDQSVSLQATDVPPSRSRFAAAQQQLRQVVDAARPGDRFDLILGGAQPRAAVRNEASAAVLAAVAQAHVEDGAADLATAVRLAAEPSVDEVIVATDGATPLDLPAQAAPVTFRLVGGQPDQLALSDVSVRQPIDGSQRLAGFASLTNFGVNPRSTTVQVVADNVLVHSQDISVNAAGRAELTFTVPTDTRNVRVTLSESDAVVADKRVDLAAPATFSRAVLVVSGQPELWTRALAPISQLTTRAIGPGDYGAPLPGEIVLFDGFLPTDLPDTERVLINPPDRAGVLARQGDEPRTVTLRDPDHSDALIGGLDLAAAGVLVTGHAHVPAWASLSAGTADDFLIGRGVLSGRRTVVLAFDPAASDLTRLAAFPLLIGNAIDWLTPGRGDVRHAGLGQAVDITPHALTSMPSLAGVARVPEWLDLWPYLAAVAELVAVTELAIATRRALVRRASAILSAASIVLVAAALLQPGLWLPDRALSVVLAVDRATSISSESQAALTTWIDDARRAKPATDRVGVVSFGAHAHVARAPSTDFTDVPPAVGEGPEATDLAEALRTAGALARGHGAGRVVLLSDGHANTGDLPAALRALDGTPVDVVPLSGQPAAPALVLEALDMPPFVRAGEPFDTSLSVGTTGQTSASLQVSLDGRAIADQQVALTPGHTRVSISQTLNTLGFHRLSVTAGDRTVEGFVMVKPPDHVMVVEERPGEATPLLNALRSSPGTFDVKPPSAINGLASVEPYAAVVLANVSATSFTLDQQRTLRTFVQERGHGLVALGGTTSFVLGGYENSTLEQILPVISTVPPRREDARLALLLVIDISQSMDRVVDGVSGIEMAKQGAVLASRALRDDDQIGVLIFNHRFSWLQPIARLGDVGRATLEDRIGSLSPSGGTEIFAALDEGVSQMRGVTADLRHVVLFTDGNSRDANYDALTTQMRQDKIGLSTVGLGPEADTKLLAKLARDGQGRFYYSDRPSELPKILAREVAIAKRSAVVEGTIQARLVGPSPILQAIAPADLPLLGGYIATTPRATAQVVLAAEDDPAALKPLLAQWRIGLGRAVAWTSDVGGPWTRQWSDWSRNAAFWQQAVAWAAGTPLQPDFLLDVRSSGSSAHITLDDLRDDQFVDLASPIATVSGVAGGDASVPLRQSAPGRYEAMVIVDRPGVYSVTVSDAGRTETSGFVVPARPELASFGPDEHTLRRIASDTGGQVLTSAAEAFRDDGRAAGQRWQRLWPVMLALGLVLFLAGLIQRRFGSMVRALVAVGAARVPRRSTPRRAPR